MNHKFKSSAGAPATCTTCQRDIMAHSDFARCEVCQKFPCTVNIYKECADYAMCEGCYASECEAKLINGSIPKPLPEPIARIEAERFDTPSMQIDKMLGDVSPLTDLPQNGDGFFNAETISHVKVQQKVFDDETIPDDKKWFTFVQQLQRRQAALQETLVGGIELIKETRSRLASVQRSQNVLASKLRAEEKAKLKIADISYKPVQAPRKVNTRMSDKDRVIEGMAKTMYAPRNDKGFIIWAELTDDERNACIDKARATYTSNVSSINVTLREEERHNKEIN